MIKPYLSDILNNYKDDWKIQLSMKISFVPSEDSEDSSKIHFLYTNSDNIIIMIGYETNDIIDKLFKSFLKTYQIGLEESMRGSKFVSDSIGLLHYRLHKISLNRGGS